MKLVFYLFDDSVVNFSDVFLPGKLTDPPSPFQLVDLREENENIRVYLQANKPGRPSWMAFFEAHCDFGDDDLINQYNSLVVVFRVAEDDETRYLALTAGHGHSALDKNLIEDDFGLTVALNTISSERLRSVDARDLGTRTQQKRLVVSYDAKPWRFAFDPELEVVGAMSGAPEEEGKDFARHVSGADSLALLRDVTWRELEQLCRDLLDRYRSREFEQRFRFATLQRRVKNRQDRDELDERMFEALRDRDAGRLAVAMPIRDVERVVESVLETGRRGGYRLAPFDIDHVFAALDHADLRQVDPRDLTIQHFDADGELLDHKSLYKHLLFEDRFISRGRKATYVFSLGQWFRLDSDHVEEVERRLEGIPVTDDQVLLPPMQYLLRKDGEHRLEREDEYNERVSVSRDFALFDKALFSEHLPGKSRIEVCDLLHRDGAFFCVKKYGGSSDLSHLFSQGTVSGQLFYRMPEYRAFTAQQIGGKWACPFDVGTGDPAPRRLVYAIACAERYQLPTDLPFFSKVTLLKAREDLLPHGWEVELAKIVMPEAPADATSERQRRRRPRAENATGA